jgi:hypothetical protein
MGYRSNLSISIDAAQYKKDVFLQKIPDNLFEDFKRTDEGDCINFSVTDIKWYDTYPEVQVIECYLDSLNEEHYRFIRVGQDNGDIVDEGYLDDDRHVNVTIDKY